VFVRRRREHRTQVQEFDAMDEMTGWLQGLGLGHYARSFVEQGIEFDLLADLGNEDLKTLGVAALGHRKRLLRAIGDLPVTSAPRA
jgi:hypothetical protein